MAAHGAFGTDFYDSSTRTIVGTMLWTKYEIRPIHSAPSLGQSIDTPSWKIQAFWKCKNYRTWIWILDVRHKADFSGFPKKDISKAKALFGAVEHVLGSSRISLLGAHVSFFDIGGHSLNAIMVLTKLRDLGYSIGEESSLSFWCHKANGNSTIQFNLG